MLLSCPLKSLLSYSIRKEPICFFHRASSEELVHAYSSCFSLFIGVGCKQTGRCEVSITFLSSRLGLTYFTSGWLRQTSYQKLHLSPRPSPFLPFLFVCFSFSLLVSEFDATPAKASVSCFVWKARLSFSTSPSLSLSIHNSKKPSTISHLPHVRFSPTHIPFPPQHPLITFFPHIVVIVLPLPTYTCEVVLPCYRIIHPFLAAPSL